MIIHFMQWSHVIYNLLAKAKLSSTEFPCAHNKFGIGNEEVNSLLAFRNLKVTKSVVAWNLVVGGVKQVDKQSHCILINFLCLVQIPEAKLDNIKGSEQWVKSSLFSDVSPVWLEELFKFWQDFMFEHNIAKLVFLFLRRIGIRFEKEDTHSLANFFRWRELCHLFKFKLHEVLVLRFGAWLAFWSLAWFGLVGGR